jgi:hypothetical protein
LRYSDRRSAKRDDGVAVQSFSPITGSGDDRKADALFAIGLEAFDDPGAA